MMGIPTIVRIDPSSGLTGGRRLIRIWGSNFQLAPPPPTSGPCPVPNPTVEVLFGGVRARQVLVMAGSLLHVTTPIHDPGAVDVIVRNIDQAGAPIAGETVTQANGFTFTRPELSNPEEAKRSNLTRLVAEVILEIRRQILENTVIATHTDYDDDTSDGANIAALAEVPGIVLSGPFLRQNRFYNSNQRRVEEDASGQSFEQRPPRTVDLGFTIIAVDDNPIRILDLVHETTAFFQRNTSIRMLRDPAVAGDYVEYELDLESDGDLKPVGTANNSNISAFSGSFVVRGLDIDDTDMAMVAAPTIQDVLPTGLASTVGAAQLPLPIILTGQPGVTTAKPVPSGPAPAPGNPGPIEQIFPDEE